MIKILKDGTELYSFDGLYEYSFQVDAQKARLGMRLTPSECNDITNSLSQYFDQDIEIQFFSNSTTGRLSEINSYDARIYITVDLPQS